MTLPFYSCSYLEPRFKMSSGKVSHPCRRCVIRELKQRWRQGQRERQQSNRLKLAKDNNLKQLCTCITLYCTFPCRHCTTLTWKCLISPFVRGSEPTRQRLSFSFPELQYSLLKFHFQKKIANIWRNERDGISTIKFEAARLQFLSDVFEAVAVAVVVA